MDDKFDLAAWIQEAEIDDAVVDVLKKNKLLKEKALLLVQEEDIKSLGLPKGDELLLINAVKGLQDSRGPRAGGNSKQRNAMPIDELLADLSIGGGGEAAFQRSNTRGEHLRIVDFVPQGTACDEEEYCLGAVTIKYGKPKLEKVSQAMWTVANTRILRQLMKTQPNFDIHGYLMYTEMVAENACRFQWQSVLVFDDQYRQRQQEQHFAWGTEQPHLAFVNLRDRASGNTAPGQRRAGTNIPRGREPCRLWNRGTCTYGGRCIFDHLCSACGKGDHCAKDHPSTSKTTQQA